MHIDVEQFFAKGGQLARAIEAYEPRHGQQELARAVQRALDKGENLLAEAGTGTGKTLAYLVPALASGRKVVVSTATKNLQEQIIGHDLALLERALGRPIDIAVMKGRANYLCEVRANAHLAQLTFASMGGKNAEALSHVRRWRDKTHTGDTSECAELPEDSPMWRDLTATSEQCTGRACQAYDRCYVTQMRRNAGAAQLVVVNHHLYLADAAMRESNGNDSGSLIPTHDAVVFDEAHELEDIATQHFGHSVTERRLIELGRDISAAIIGTGLLANRLKLPLSHIEPRTRKLFDALPFQPGRLRLLGDFATDDVRALHEDLDNVLVLLESELGEAQEDEVKALGKRVAQVAHALAFVLAIPHRDSLTREMDTNAGSYVRYSEAGQRHRALVARPVDVASLLGQTFRRIPTVFVSATLRVSKSFIHFRRQVGIFEAEEVAVESPFDYHRQACLYLPNDLPETNAPEFAQQAAARAAELVKASGGGAFVLCTSHRSLPLMRDALVRAGVAQVFTQGDAPKSHLVDAFRARTDAALVATMGFWRGVDVPGAALRLVILDRLPFAVPTDPLIEARLEHLQEQGVEPFMGFQVPQAALLLQQGFGRLIRRQSDHGVVAILDRRLTTKRYGPLLLRSLPACRRVHDFDEIVGVVQNQRARLLHPSKPGFVIKRKTAGKKTATDLPDTPF